MIVGSPAIPSRDQKPSFSEDSHPDWFEGDLRWLVAQRIVAGPHFARSRLLSNFLLYIVAETLQNRQNEITERQIGVHVFDRPPSYRSIEDNIVRTYARQLRRRLADYFASEGASEQLHIEIPLGGYVPVFVPAQSTAASDETISMTLPSAPPDSAGTQETASGSPASSRRTSGRVLQFTLWLAVYSAILACTVWFAAIRFYAPRAPSPVTAPTQKLWAELFGGPANCYIVPADAGFNLLEDLSHRSLPLASYMRGNYLNLPLSQVDAHSAEDLRTQQFTSFVDLQIATALARLPEFNPQRVVLRFARDLQLDDLKNSNAVILGSMSSNPWAAIGEADANFRIVHREGMQGATIVNVMPRTGEQASYVSHWNEPAHETFAIIAYRPNLGRSGHLLILQGLDVAGTQAAAETLFQSAAIAPILRRATRPDGSLRFFEILLRSTSIKSNAIDTQVIDSRIY